VPGSESLERSATEVDGTAMACFAPVPVRERRSARCCVRAPGRARTAAAQWCARGREPARLPTGSPAAVAAVGAAGAGCSQLRVAVIVSRRRVGLDGDRAQSEVQSGRIRVTAPGQVIACGDAVVRAVSTRRLLSTEGSHPGEGGVSYGIDRRTLPSGPMREPARAACSSQCLTSSRARSGSVQRRGWHRCGPVAAGLAGVRHDTNDLADDGL
jgi:hypothetical protein